MSTHERFDINRFIKLTVNDLRFQAKTILIFSVAMLVFFLIMPFDFTNGSGVYLALLYIGGFIITSSAFKDLHDHQRAHLYLMLPCSSFERFFSRWFLTSIGYAIGLLGLYYLFLLLRFLILLSSVNLGISHQHIQLMNIVEPGLWISIGKYIIFQSVVLLGAISFKKHSLIKTALILGCFFLVLNFFSMIMFFMFFSHFLIDPHASIHFMTPHTTTKHGYFIYWLFAAPVFWYTTYLKLTEFELR